MIGMRPTELIFIALIVIVVFVVYRVTQAPKE
jgi:hypothetical protein